MALDFTEIAAPHKKSTDQVSDAFEQFARSFLVARGFELAEGPSRGPDGGKDLVVIEVSPLTQKRRRWLVSCKHKAFSQKAVNSKDEENLSNRVKKAKCVGFIPFYSTIPTSDLEADFRTLEAEDGVDVDIYDSGRIEGFLLNTASPTMTALAKQYFPASYSKWLRHSRKLRVCLTIQDLQVLSILRNTYSTYDVVLQSLLTRLDVELFMAPWTWAQVHEAREAAGLMADVIKYFEIKEMPQPLVLVAQDLFSAAPAGMTFGDYVNEIERFDVDQFIKGVERKLKHVRSLKSVSESIGAMLGLKAYEVANLGKASKREDLCAAIQRHLGALKPSEQLVNMLIVDTELSDQQKTDRAYATLTDSSLPGAMEAHQRVPATRIPAQASLDSRVYGVIKSVTAHWLATSIDFSTMRASELKTKMPHLRAMLSYLFGDGKGFKPLHTVVDTRALIKTMFLLIYAPESDIFSVSGHPLASRLKHGLAQLTKVREGSALWDEILAAASDQEKKDLLNRLTDCCAIARASSRF